ncbi:hypothetical protein A9K55_001818 [Cordyceps militaris]|uniref:Uncharacterized protein n=1 Tax=Cordyceps militaris TaxID=73501 RepID=A0A2H4SSS2_CORMI|nr:hypothetical protein A9K55_001818 [Cordyceps militaris]
MQHTTIKLSDDQEALVAEACRALKREPKQQIQLEKAAHSPESAAEGMISGSDKASQVAYSPLSRESRQLYESLGDAALQKIRDIGFDIKMIKKYTIKVPSGAYFKVQECDALVAIQLASLETRLPVEILLPDGTFDNWSAGVACILPRGWAVRSETGELWMDIWRYFTEKNA